MSRDIIIEPDENCDICGKKAAFDFMGDCLCNECFGDIYFLPTIEEVETEDGTGQRYCFYSEKDEVYIATIIGVESISAIGKTREEALAELEKAKEDWDETS